MPSLSLTRWPPRLIATPLLLALLLQLQLRLQLLFLLLLQLLLALPLPPLQLQLLRLPLWLLLVLLLPCIRPPSLSLAPSFVTVDGAGCFKWRRRR
jgi:hypothetical protein